MGQAAALLAATASRPASGGKLELILSGGVRSGSPFIRRAMWMERGCQQNGAPRLVPSEEMAVAVPPSPILLLLLPHTACRLRLLLLLAGRILGAPPHR